MTSRFFFARNPRSCSLVAIAIRATFTAASRARKEERAIVNFLSKYRFSVLVLGYSKEKEGPTVVIQRQDSSHKDIFFTVSRWRPDSESLLQSMKMIVIQSEISMSDFRY